MYIYNTLLKFFLSFNVDLYTYEPGPGPMDSGTSSNRFAFDRNADAVDDDIGIMDCSSSYAPKNVYIYIYLYIYLYIYIYT
jgi:hypothetical protein